jgi:hypothetical protein
MTILLPIIKAVMAGSLLGQTISKTTREGAADARNKSIHALRLDIARAAVKYASFQQGTRGCRVTFSRFADRSVDLVVWPRT